MGDVGSDDDDRLPVPAEESDGPNGYGSDGQPATRPPWVGSYHSVEYNDDLADILEIRTDSEDDERLLSTSYVDLADRV